MSDLQLQEAINFYKRTLERFGFHHNFTRTVVHIINTLYGHEGTLALQRANESLNSTTPKAPSYASEEASVQNVVLIASGQQKQEASASESAKQEESAKKKRQPRQINTQAKPRRKKAQETPQQSAPAADSQLNDWPWNDD